MKIFIVWFGLFGCWAIFKKWRGQGAVICGVVWNLYSVCRLILDFLASRCLLVGWSLDGHFLFRQLGFVWHSVALIFVFNVISCSLFSCIYVIAIQNFFPTSLILLSLFSPNFSPFFFLFFPCVTLWYSSCLIFFLSPSLLQVNSPLLQPPPPDSLVRSCSSVSF